MVKTYRPETEQWLGSSARKPFGQARCRSGLEVITAVFPDNRSQRAHEHVDGSGQLRVKVLNPTIRDQPNVSVRSRLQEHLVEWQDHSTNGRTMLRTPLDVPGTARGARFRSDRSLAARFTVCRSGLETILTELQLDGKIDTIYDAQSEVHVDLAAPSGSPRRRSGAAPLVFVGYARSDRDWFRRFIEMLSPAVKNQRLELWSDREIPPGANWQEEISTALNDCDAALLLVTPAFHASDYITDVELQTLLDLGKRIYWVAVTACMHEETKLAPIQCVNDPRSPITSFDPAHHDRHIADACKEVVDRLST